MVSKDMIKAESVQFFHILQAMIKSGDFAKLSPHAAKVYVVIKSFVNFENPEAFPSIERIVRDSGVSKSSAIRGINELVELGYLVKDSSGRHNTYRIIEKIRLLDDDGEQQSVVSWEYIPKHTVNALNELKEFLAKHDMNGESRYIHVEHLQVVVAQMAEGATMTNINGNATNTTQSGPSERDEVLTGQDYFDTLSEAERAKLAPLFKIKRRR